MSSSVATSVLSVAFSYLPPVTVELWPPQQQYPLASTTNFSDCNFLLVSKSWRHTGRLCLAVRLCIGGNSGNHAQNGASQIYPQAFAFFRWLRGTFALSFEVGYWPSLILDVMDILPPSPVLRIVVFRGSSPKNTHFLRHLAAKHRFEDPFCLDSGTKTTRYVRFGITVSDKGVRDWLFIIRHRLLKKPTLELSFQFCPLQLSTPCPRCTAPTIHYRGKGCHQVIWCGNCSYEWCYYEWCYAAVLRRRLHNLSRAPRCR